MEHSLEQNVANWIEKIQKCNQVNPELYVKYEVKRGLRDISGKGVLAGLTRIGEVHSYIMDEFEMIPVPGKLMYRGIDVTDIINGYQKDKRFGFEETCYLLLMGDLPTKSQLEALEAVLAQYRNLPENFTRDMILKSPSKDMMNVLARCVLLLYSFDESPDDISVQNVLRQSLQLIAMFPLLATYGYQAFAHYHGNQSLIIHSPNPELSTAENILHMLRADNAYTRLEAELLDMALVLHAEHGGGNNSSFTTHVVTSTGTDTYSVMAAALGSLKGPRHGGANIKVSRMIADIKEHLSDWKDETQISDYLGKLLHKQAFDKSGLIYGMGHAVYSISDPRAVIFKKFVEKLAEEKGRQEEFDLLERIERLAPQVIAKEKKIYKGVSANVDFYSGFVYQMIGIPEELYTPLFAISRIAGWCAHRMEELVNNGKIIRPAYKCIEQRREYVNFNER
ncbi:MAG: citrate/2-methylcitrate synthase [Sedimentisphaerales bacterium]|nr:citrate/2-methylcitrate synthase [Sedimentisphaerales bacterium]